MIPQARFRLLGGFALECQGTHISINSQRLQALLAYLVLHPQTPPTRQQLSFLLWPDSSDAQAHTNLRTLLHRLQTVFPDIAQVINISPQTVAWQPDITVRSDVADFEEVLRLANEAVQVGSDPCKALERAAAAYTGDLLPDCYDEWVLTERE